MKKVEFYGPINNELGVIMAFSKLHEELGFSKLVPSSSRGFDIDSIEYKGQEVTVEFEYLSSNFISHGHHRKMLSGQKYVVVCWEDNSGLVSKLKNDYKRELYDLIELRKYVLVKKDLNYQSKSDEPLYVVLSYNPATSGVDFGEWAFSKCYRVKTTEKTKKFAGDYLPPNSKILFYHNGYVIGGCTVVRYEIIDEPKTESEWTLYKKLTDFPQTLFTLSITDLKENFLRGHIFYTDFFDLRNVRIKLSNFVSKRMPQQGKMNLTKEQYYSIIGF